LHFKIDDAPTVIKDQLDETPATTAA